MKSLDGNKMNIPLENEMILIGVELEVGLNN